MLAAAILVVPAAGASRTQPRPHRTRTRAAARPGPPEQLPCGDPVAFAVLLDRQGFSPGEIDGKIGGNFARALAALQQAHGIPMTARPDCDTWHALGGDTNGPAVAPYTLTEEDLKGPFTPRIPRDIVHQATLKALDYRSPLEALGERFHTSPGLLRRLNPGVHFAAGVVIDVPAVVPFDDTVKPTHDPAFDDVTILVSREESALRATRPDGSLVFFAPVSSGSIHDPLPPGIWTVASVDWMPPFHYNPRLFWDAKPTHTRATIEPGPNGPVGVVWIGLNLEHYGLHGTPEPGRIGYTESHGCVRLTNWDAARVAALVKRGTPVIFR